MIALGEAQGEPRKRVLLVTGLSGAGLSSSLRALEDLGWEIIDNLPFHLLESVLRDASDRALAIGLHARTRGISVQGVVDILDSPNPDVKTELLYLECDDDILLHRYTETRARHPFSQDRLLQDGIQMERALLSPLRDRAAQVVDTSKLTLQSLRRHIASLYELTDSPQCKLVIESFSYRHGLPREADIILDVRFLSNPHYVPHLKHKTGLDSEVAAHIAADPEWAGFFTHLTTLLSPLLPRYTAEGKSCLTIAFGCTGGQHRSVFAATRLAEWLGAHGTICTVEHRDIPRYIMAAE